MVGILEHRVTPGLATPEFKAILEQMEIQELKAILVMLAQMVTQALREIQALATPEFKAILEQMVIQALLETQEFKEIRASGTLALLETLGHKEILVQTATPVHKATLA